MRPNVSNIREKAGVCSIITSFRHALGLLDPGVEHLLGRHKEDAVSSLASIYHTQLVHQEAATTLHVLPPHLEPKQMGICDQVGRVDPPDGAYSPQLLLC